MQKRVTVIAISLMVLLMVGVVVVVVLMTNAGYSKQANANDVNIQKAQSDIGALQADKDANSFTPTDVVKDFFAEVKSDAVDKAKLYLAPEVQNMDTKATLKLGSDYSNITTGDNLEQDSGADKIVSMTFVLEAGDTTVRTFTLSKYVDVWKITGVTAE